jgi:uridine phosphorylase
MADQTAALAATFPILEFDSNREALINPGALIRSRTEMPAACVLCFFHDVIADLQDAGLLTAVASLRSEMGAHPVYRLSTPAGAVALLHPGVGAPLAAALLEEAIALGGRAFVACGGAGVLDPSIAVGTVLVPAAALRDEGTSYHYLPPAREVALAPAVVAALEAALTTRGVPHRRVKTWTTDAFYRETTGRIARRKAEGCACVEMETAALCAVAQFRQVTFGQLLYGGDDVSGAAWDSRGWTGKRSVREQLTLLAAEIAATLV